MRYNAAQKITSNDSLWSHDDHKTGVSLHTPGPRGDLPKDNVSFVIRNKFTEDTKPNLSSKLKIQQISHWVCFIQKGNLNKPSGNRFPQTFQSYIDATLRKRY